MRHHRIPSICFFYTDPPTPDIYTLSLHDALPISFWKRAFFSGPRAWPVNRKLERSSQKVSDVHNQKPRSEEHTSELQSRGHLVCRLLLEKKKRRPRPPRPSRTSAVHTPRPTCTTT